MCIRIFNLTGNKLMKYFGDTSVTIAYNLNLLRPTYRDSFSFFHEDHHGRSLWNRAIEASHNTKTPQLENRKHVSKT